MDHRVSCDFHAQEDGSSKLGVLTGRTAISDNLDLFVVHESAAIAEKGWCSMFWRLVAFLGLSLINPLCMAVSFCVCMGMDVYRPTSTNVVTFDARFFPIYLTTGMLVLLLQLFLVYGIARLIYRGRRVTVAKVARAFLSAQKPFLFLVLALPLLLGDVEGNVLPLVRSLHFHLSLSPESLQPSVCSGS